LLAREHNTTDVPVVNLIQP